MDLPALRIERLTINATYYDQVFSNAISICQNQRFIAQGFACFVTDSKNISNAIKSMFSGRENLYFTISKLSFYNKKVIDEKHLKALFGPEFVICENDTVYEALEYIMYFGKNNYDIRKLMSIFSLNDIPIKDLGNMRSRFEALCKVVYGAKIILIDFSGKELRECTRKYGVIFVIVVEKKDRDDVFCVDSLVEVNDGVFTTDLGDDRVTSMLRSKNVSDAFLDIVLDGMMDGFSGNDEELENMLDRRSLANMQSSNPFHANNLDLEDDFMEYEGVTPKNKRFNVILDDDDQECNLINNEIGDKEFDNERLENVYKEEEYSNLNSRIQTEHDRENTKETYSGVSVILDEDAMGSKYIFNDKITIENNKIDSEEYGRIGTEEVPFNDVLGHNVLNSNLDHNEKIKKEDNKIDTVSLKRDDEGCKGFQANSTQFDVIIDESILESKLVEENSEIGAEEVSVDKSKINYEVICRRELEVLQPSDIFETENIDDDYPTSLQVNPKFQVNNSSISGNKAFQNFMSIPCDSKKVTRSQISIRVDDDSSSSTTIATPVTQFVLSNKINDEEAAFDRNNLIYPNDKNYIDKRFEKKYVRCYQKKTDLYPLRRILCFENYVISYKHIKFLTKRMIYKQRHKGFVWLIVIVYLMISFIFPIIDIKKDCIDSQETMTTLLTPFISFRHKIYQNVSHFLNALLPNNAKKILIEQNCTQSPNIPLNFKIHATALNVIFTLYSLYIVSIDAKTCRGNVKVFFSPNSLFISFVAAVFITAGLPIILVSRILGFTLPMPLISLTVFSGVMFSTMRYFSYGFLRTRTFIQMIMSYVLFFGLKGYKPGDLLFYTRRIDPIFLASNFAFAHDKSWLVYLGYCTRMCFVFALVCIFHISKM